jgi:hypothetical protein
MAGERANADGWIKSFGIVGKAGELASHTFGEIAQRHIAQDVDVIRAVLRAPFDADQIQQVIPLLK